MPAKEIAEITARANREIAREFRRFAEQSASDDEVQSLFTKRAAARETSAAELEAALAGFDPSNAMREEWSGEEETPRSTVLEERILHDLIHGFGLERESAASFESLSRTAFEESLESLGTLADQHCAASRQAAEQFHHLLPSRAKIAFNMCTVNELDPSVETKLTDDRIREA